MYILQKERKLMKIKKYNLMSVFQFLEKATLVGSASRARTKLNKQIGEAISELQEDETKLAKDMGGSVDENGHVDFILESNDDDEAQKEYTQGKHIAFAKEQSELRQEEALFTEKTQGQFESLKNALYDYEEKLSGQDAVVYDILLDSLEEE